MIISCPECGGKFRIDAAKLGAGGRTVRCGKCAHTWRQAPPEADDADEAAVAPAEAADSPAAGARAAIERAVAAIDDGGDAEDSIDWDAPSVADDDGADHDVVAARRRRRVPPPDVEAGSSRWPAMAAWSGLVVVIAALGWGAIAFRDSVMETWPETAALYDRLDLARPGFGLVLAPPRAEQTQVDGATALVIEGRIENPTHRAREVPKLLRLQLFDKNQRELQTETFAAPVELLMPQQSATYRIELRDPSDKRDLLLITFAEGST